MYPRSAEYNRKAVLVAFEDRRITLEQRDTLLDLISSLSTNPNPAKDTPKHVSIEDMDKREIDSSFTSAVQDPSAKEVVFPSHAVSDNIVFSSGYESCVGVVIFGSSGVGLSHYDSVDIAKQELKKAETACAKWKKQAELKNDPESQTGLRNATEYYKQVLGRLNAMLTPRDNIRALKSSLQSKDLLSVVIGGDYECTKEMIAELKRQGITVVGLYMRDVAGSHNIDEHEYTRIDGNAQLYAQQNTMQSQCNIPNRFQDHSVIVGLAKQKQVIVKDGSWGLIQICLG